MQHCSGHLCKAASQWFIAQRRVAHGFVQTAGSSNLCSSAPINCTSSCMANVPQDSVKPDEAVKVTLPAVFEVAVDCSRLFTHGIQLKTLQLCMYSDSSPDRQRSVAAAATGQPYQDYSLQPHSALAPAAAAAFLAQLARSAAQFAAVWRATPYLDPLPFCYMTCAPRSFHHGEAHM